MSADPRREPETADEALERFVSVALELVGKGIDPPLDEICEGRPELRDRVASAIELAAGLPQLHRRARRQDPLVGRTLDGRYRVEAPIGSGAMGVVYRGFDEDLKRPVAIKVLRSELFSGPEAERRFVREAESLAALNHPAVVTVFDRGSMDGDVPYLVMELLDGVPLSAIMHDAAASAARDGSQNRVERTDWLAERLASDAPLETSWIRQVASWIAELAAGVGAANEAGIYHRDIKPSNVFVREDGQPVLIDFGIVARADQATIASRDDALGTPAYMAPEQLNTTVEPSPALDVYGLTATLYHLLTLRAPYGGSPSQVIARMMRHGPTPAYRIRTDLPRDLQAILDCGMARRPADRYGSALELAADLNAFLAHRPVAARPLNPVQRAWRGARQSREFRAVAVVICLLVLAGVAYAVDAALDRARAAEWLARYRTVPPALTLSQSLAARVVADEDERHRIAGLLDELVRLADRPIPSAMLRASFRLDHGDVAGAVADVGRIDASVGTPYTKALLSRYRAIPPDARTSEAIDLAGLPEPETGDDRYLAAYHAVRAGISADNADAIAALLEHPDTRDHLAAQEMLIVARGFGALTARDHGEAMRRFRAVHDLVVRFEELIGCRTATTAQFASAVLIGQERFADAADALRDGLALAPDSNGLRINLAQVLRRTGKLGEAEAALSDAIRIQPETTKAWINLARVQLDARAFDRARKTIDAARFSDGARGRVERLLLEARFEKERALVAWRADRLDDAQSAARRVLAHAAAIEELGGRVPEFERGIATAILERSPDGIFTPILDALRRDPLNWRQLEDLIHYAPDRLDDKGMNAFRRYLEALVDKLAPIEDREAEGR